MLMKEKIVATTMILAGGAFLALSWRGVQGIDLSFGQILAAALLTTAIVLADRYPIHLLRGTKASMASIPIYLAVVLLPIHLAVTTAGAGMLLSSLQARAKRKLILSDILGQTGRWLVISFIGHQVATLSIQPEIDRIVLLLGSACTLLLADFISFSLSLSFIVNEPFIVSLKSAFREGLMVEGIQYLIGIIGAFAALQDMWILPLVGIPAAITYLAFKRNKELQQNTKQLLEEFADSVDLRDVYTGGHSRRVAESVRKILNHLQISGPEADLIVVAARLHDIGKVAVPDELLTKPGKLSPEDWEIMKSHSKKGADLLANYSDFARGATLILHHHEAWNGNGYPDHLKGYDIPFGSRIIAVVDSYDAMTSDRPYRRAMSTGQAMSILREGSRQQWDPDIVDTFINILIEEQTEAVDVTFTAGQLSTEFKI